MSVRDPVTGRYAFDGDFAMMCVCGHPLGVHAAGGFGCLNRGTGDGTDCDCRKFRSSRKNPE